MIKRFLPYLLAIGLALTGVTTFAQPVAVSANTTKQVYQLAVFACKGEVITNQEFATIIAAINQTLVHEKLELQVLNREQIYQGLQQRTLDFVATNPTHFLIARHQFDVTGALVTLARNNQGQALNLLGGTIIARADNQQVNNLVDLASRRIAAPGEDFMSGYRAQLYELLLAGVQPKKHNIQFVGSHQATVNAVLNGDADVGFIRAGILEEMVASEKLDISQLKVLNAQYRPDFPHLLSTRLYPEWPVFAMPHVSEQAKRHITAALLRFELDDLQHSDSAIYGFSVPVDYLSVEQLSRALRLPPFDQQPTISWQDLTAQYGKALIWVLLLLMALLTSLVVLIFWVKKAQAANTYSQELLASQDEIVLVNNGQELVDVSGGFLKFFKGYYASLAAFKRDYRCICDLFVRQEGYLYNHHAMEWIEVILSEPKREHKAIVGFQRQRTVFKCSGVYSEKLGLYLITLVDITQLEHFNQQLIEQTRIAGQANQAKSSFLANMSHEIRTPMNSIIGLSELALKEHNLDQVHLRLQKIHYSASLLLGIINDILDISKIEAGHFTLDVRCFDLHRLLVELVELYRPQALKKGLNVTLELDPKLANHFVADELRLRQVLINLLSNAIKFTDLGAITLRVSPVIRLDEMAAEAIHFEVQDTGKGISLEQQQRLFKPFSQADDSITRQYGGTGLGLVISDKLVQLMGGESIKIQSDLGQGSVFSFRLPLVAASPQEVAQLERSAQQTSQQAWLVKQQQGLSGRVLLVEDNEINQQVSGALLNQLGLDYEVAANGEQALNQLKLAHYDLILMDVQMPIMDGYQATRAIRRFNTQVPIIALTAAAMAEDKEKALAAGMNEHLAKPIERASLLACLTRWLNHSKAFKHARILLAHPDNQRLKAVLPNYPQQAAISVANSLEKMTQLLQEQADISQLVVADEWRAQAEQHIAALERKVKVDAFADEYK